MNVNVSFVGTIETNEKWNDRPKRLILREYLPGSTGIVYDSAQVQVTRW